MIPFVYWAVLLTLFFKLMLFVTANTTGIDRLTTYPDHQCDRALASVLLLLTAFPLMKTQNLRDMVNRNRNGFPTSEHHHKYIKQCVLIHTMESTAQDFWCFLFCKCSFCCFHSLYPHCPEDCAVGPVTLIATWMPCSACYLPAYTNGVMCLVFFPCLSNPFFPLPAFPELMMQTKDIKYTSF